MIIYKITNRLNGKVYIGQTRYSLEHRMAQHFRRADAGDNTHLYQAIRKYGRDAFEFCILCRAYSKDELNRLETFYIQQYDSIKTGYNMVDGGDNNVMDLPGVKATHDATMRSEEVRQKLSQTMKRKVRNGELFTEEHRRHLSEAAMGNHNGGTGDTRSLGCWCVDEYDTEHHFHSYRDAWKWWSSVQNVFDSTAECVYQRKIKESIATGKYTYKGETYYLPEWHKEVVLSEVTNPA